MRYTCMKCKRDMRETNWNRDKPAIRMCGRCYRIHIDDLKKIASYRRAADRKRTRGY